MGGGGAQEIYRQGQPLFNFTVRPFWWTRFGLLCKGDIN